MEREIHRLAPDNIGLDDAAGGGQQGVDPALLFQPAANPAHLVKGRQRLGGGVDVGGLAVVDVAHAVDLRDGLTAVRQAGKTVKRGLDQTRRDAKRARGGIGGASVLVVVRPRQPSDRTQIDRGDLLALAPFGQKPLARVDHPARSHQLAPRRDTDHAVIDRPFGELVGEVLPLDLIDTDHRAVRAPFGEQTPLGREIAPEACVPVQMVGREVSKNGDVRRKGACEVGLVTRQLQHHDAAVLRLVQIQHAAPDIPGKLRGTAGGLKNVVDQRRGRRFAVRSGDGDHLGLNVEFVPLAGRE